MPIGNALAVIRSQKEIFFEFDIVISSDKSAWDLSVELTALGWNGTSPIRGKVVINAGVTISGVATTATNRNGGVSFLVGSYNKKSQIAIENYGSIVGSGGFGGYGDTGLFAKDTSGGNGGTALKVNSKITLLNKGVINGGGGGGGASVGGGGGGAGIPAGGGGYGTRACMNFANQVCCYTPIAGTAGTATTGGAGGVPAPPVPFVSWADKPNGGKGGALGAVGIDSGVLRIWPYEYKGKGGGGGYSVSNWTNVTLDPASTGSFLGTKA